MANRPTGTVTFLFTDVQGSTRLWETHPRAMRAALARHDFLLQQAIQKCGGAVVKHQGDGFYAAFSTPRQAIEASLQAQRSLLAEQWGETGPIQVRMALHTGEAEERDGDYFGTVVNRTARLAEAGHGGQILVSGTTAQLVRDGLWPGVSLRDLGQHRLRDLARADHIYQLVAPGLPLEFPSLRTLSSRPNNLPVQTTSFVGRAHNISEVRRLLEQSRLVTLIGPGGVGKTRLALEVAAQVLHAYPDGVWFTDLAPLTDPKLLPQTVASAMSVREQQGEAIELTLLAALQGRKLLLLLDNCEHIIEACAQLASELLRNCPDIRILATSRESLRISAEVRCQVQPLTVPSSHEAGDLDQLREFDAVRLFIDRASVIAPGISITHENSSSITEIVRHLDGIPLAIELAAARVNVLSIEQIAQRLDNRFHLLKRGNRTALPRQQTLEALIDWSYNLLAEDEQVLFQRLSVFPGGFTLEAAEVICAGNVIAQYDVVDLLSQLVEKSLVVVDEHTEEYRYRLLESLREYARRQLQPGTEESRLKRRHASYYLSLAEQAEPNLFSDNQREWTGRLRAEADNVRAALEWSRTGDVETGLRLATALWRVWWLGSQVSEGRSQLERLWNTLTDTIPLEIRLNALYARGNLAFRDGDYAAARSHFNDMSMLAEETGDRKHLIMAVSALGGMLVEQMDYEPAAELLRKSLQLEETLTDVPSSPWVRIDLGLIELGRGDFTDAHRLFQESLSSAERDGDNLRIAVAHCCLGLAALPSGELTTSRTHFSTSLKLSSEEQLHWMIPVVLDAFAAVAVQENLLSRGVQLAAAAATLREATGVPLAPLWRQLLNPPLEEARSQLDPAVWTAAWKEGSSMSLDQAVDYALSNVETIPDPSVDVA